MNSVRKIWTVAKFTWLGLWMRRFGVVALLAVVLCILLPAQMMLDPASPPEVAQQSMHMLLGIAYGVGMIATVLAAAGAVPTELNQRTLGAVLVHPIERYEFLLGKLLGIMLAFVQFIALALLAGFLVSRGQLPGDVFISAAFALGTALTWASMALAISALTSSVFAIGSFLVAMAVNKIIGAAHSGETNVGVHFLQSVVHALSKADVSDVASWSSALALAENVGYGFTVFILCAWWFERNDLRLRA